MSTTSVTRLRTRRRRQRREVTDEQYRHHEKEDSHTQQRPDGGMHAALRSPKRDELPT
jgi:hypothetical protein